MMEGIMVAVLAEGVSSDRGSDGGRGGHGTGTRGGTVAGRGSFRGGDVGHGGIGNSEPSAFLNAPLIFNLHPNTPARVNARINNKDETELIH